MKALTSLSRLAVFSLIVIATSWLSILREEPAALGLVYHVDPLGVDDNPGTSPELAWRTIDRANRHDFKPGDRLLFAGGKMHVGNLVLEANDAGTPGGGASSAVTANGRTINAGLGTGVLVKDAGGVEVRDLLCVGSRPERRTKVWSGFVNTGHLATSISIKAALIF